MEVPFRRSDRAARRSCRIGRRKLEARLRLRDGDELGAALTAAFPEESAGTISTEGDISMDLLVRTIEVLRGDSCKLAGYARGEGPGADCLFWSPVIASYG